MVTGSPLRRHVHPFPARMASELALDKIELLTEPGATVLDPMCGSGTVVRLATEGGRAAVGVDIDPLAVMITRTACHGGWAKDLGARAEDMVKRASRLGHQLPEWIRRDAETREFVSYWFAPEQADDLSRIARVLIKAPPSADPLRVAFSRMIVTKERSASLARDTSHSRPHRVADTNDYNVLAEFVKSARKLEALINTSRTAHRPSIRRADARSLGFIKEASVDLTVTSPPYLNAIDYLRGHRMSLVWMGWTVGTLRDLRGGVIGVERRKRDAQTELRTFAEAAVPTLGQLPERWQGIVLRFGHDLQRLARSLSRVTKPYGHVVMVVANSQLRGVTISNASICASAMERRGFTVVDETTRPLAARHRYLPPPATTPSTLSQRMNEEIVYTFQRH